MNFAFKSVLKTADETALIDSGATENFIDVEVWRALNIGWFCLAKTIPVHNVDGSINKNGNIDSYVWLKVRFGRQEKNMKFYLTSIGKERFILGYPFLRAFNPAILEGKYRLKPSAFDAHKTKYAHYNGKPSEKKEGRRQDKPSSSER